MIRAVCTSDREFRDGYNDVMKSPMYDDQLLQQESSLDLDEIQKYNDAKKKEREEIERKKREKEEAEKPRYCMWKTFFFYCQELSNWNSWNLFISFNTWRIHGVSRCVLIVWWRWNCDLYNET